MDGTKVYVFRKVRSGIFVHCKDDAGNIIRTTKDGHDILTREDIENLMDYANDQCQLFEVPFGEIKMPPQFKIAADRLVDDHQGRALTIAVDGKTGDMGWSFCHEGDQFSRELGTLLAVNRLAIKTGEVIFRIGKEGYRFTWTIDMIRWTIREKYRIRMQRKGG